MRIARRFKSLQPAAPGTRILVRGCWDSRWTEDVIDTLPPDRLLSSAAVLFWAVYVNCYQGGDDHGGYTEGTGNRALHRRLLGK